MADRKLIVMLKPAHEGVLVPMLCYEDGEPLPNQFGLTIQVAADDISRVTVDFAGVGFADDEGRLRT